MKLVMNTTRRPETCKTCQKIITKQGRVEKEKEKIRRWKREEQRGHQRRASIEAAEETIRDLDREIDELNAKRAYDYHSMNRW